MKKSSSQKVYFWSLVVEPGYVQGAIWTIEGESTHVLSIGPSTSWDTDEDLINATDATLSSAVIDFSEDEEPTKTVFGVSPSWVSNGQITREILDKLRTVCNKLSLEPTGFVVLPEAIAHFIKSEEGTPLNGIVIGLSAESLDVAVFRLGNLVGTVAVSKSVSIVDDVIEGLTRFGITEPLPSRFLLYNGKSAELEEARQALVKADWTGELSEKVKFLHTPAVEVIDPDKKTVAVCLAGASEVGNVSKVIFPKLVKNGHVESEQEEELLDQEMPQVEELVQSITPSDIGFVVGKDISGEAALSEAGNVVEAGEVPEHIASTLKATKQSLTSPISKISQVLGKLKNVSLNFPRKKSSGSSSTWASFG